MLVFVIVSLLLSPTAALPTVAPDDPVVADGKSLGLIVEKYGVVMQEQSTCSVVLFGFQSWLSSWTFPAEAKRIANNTPISEYNALTIILEKATLYTNEVRSLYANLTSNLTEWTVDAKTTHPSVPVPVKLTHMDQKRNPTLDEHITTEIKTYLFREQMNQLVYRYLDQVTRVIDALHRKNLVNDAIMFLGGERFYRDLARQILGSQFSGGLVDVLGIRMADLTRIAILGKVGDYDIAVRVCMPNLHSRLGMPMYYIRPWGKLEGSLYSHPLLPLMYAQGKGHHGINELLVAEDILVEHGNFTVVAHLREQATNCRLTTISKCYDFITDIDENNGTIFLPLKENNLIVTHEKEGHCIYPILADKPFPIHEPIFVREAAGCKVKVGDKSFGGLIEYHLKPDPVIVFYDPTNDISKWEVKETGNSWALSLALPALGFSLNMIVIVVVGVIIFMRLRKVRGIAETASNNVAQISLHVK